MTSGRCGGALVALSAGLLAWSALVVPALPPGPVPRAVANAGATAALLLGAQRAGFGWAELGVGRATWRRGARWGGTALAAGAVGYGVALAVPASRELVAGFAPDGATTGDLLARGLVLIPLGVVLCEEVAFRGVLLAVALRRLPLRPAVLATSVVFGLWHVAGALPDSPTSPITGAASVLGTVVLTGLAGALFAWLRLRSGSLLAPAGLHLASNSVGLLAAAVAAAAR